MKNTFLVTGYTQYPLKEIVAVVEAETKEEAMQNVKEGFTYCRIETAIYYKRQCKTTNEELQKLAEMFPNAHLNGDISVQYTEEEEQQYAEEDDIYE